MRGLTALNTLPKASGGAPDPHWQNPAHQRSADEQFANGAEMISVQVANEYLMPSATMRPRSSSLSAIYNAVARLAPIWTFSVLEHMPNSVRRATLKRWLTACFFLTSPEYPFRSWLSTWLDSDSLNEMLDILNRIGLPKN